MSRHNDELYIHHIRQAGEKIIRRLRGISWDSFDSDDVLQDAVIRQMEIIGEAAAHISEEFRLAHPQMDWRGMKDLRNVLIHGYAEVNIDRVWNIAHTKVPSLYHQLVDLSRDREEERE